MSPSVQPFPAGSMVLCREQGVNLSLAAAPPGDCRGATQSLPLGQKLLGQPAIAEDYSQARRPAFRHMNLRRQRFLRRRWSCARVFHEFVYIPGKPFRAGRAVARCSNTRQLLPDKEGYQGEFLDAIKRGVKHPQLPLLGLSLAVRLRGPGRWQARRHCGLPVWAAGLWPPVPASYPSRSS